MSHQWRVSWQRPGCQVGTTLYKTEKGARAKFDRLNDEGEDSDCLARSYDPAEPGASCIDRGEEGDNRCVICAEKYAGNVTMEVRSVGEWKSAVEKR